MSPLSVYFPIIKVLSLGTISFMVAFIWAPFFLRFLRRAGLGKNIRSLAEAPVMSQLHGKKKGTPTMGGVLVWVTTIFLAAISLFTPFNFVTRSQTWLPLFALFVTALVGLLDDFFNVRHVGGEGGGLRIRHRLLIYSAIAAVGAWWFYAKLGWDFLQVPFWGPVMIGAWYIPLFFLVIVATSHSVNVTDGLDGLAGGILLTSFTAFGMIAFVQGKIDLASLCAVIVGSLLAFLWFNINPAQFFMGDTGAMSLGVTLGVIAMLTNSALLLPVIGSIFVIESCSVLAQVASKKLRGKKLLLSSPLHHHLEAKGWTEPQIVMRFWMIAGVSATVGMILALLDQLV